MNIRETDLPDTGVFKAKSGSLPVGLIFMVVLLIIVSTYGLLRLIPLDTVTTGEVTVVRPVIASGPLTAIETEIGYDGPEGERRTIKQVRSKTTMMEGDLVRVSYAASLPFLNKVEALEGYSKAPLLNTVVPLRGRR